MVIAKMTLSCYIEVSPLAEFSYSVKGVVNSEQEQTTQTANYIKGVEYGRI